MQTVDPPDLKLWPTLRHLFPLWRAQWRLAALGLTCALIFTGLFPWIAARLIPFLPLA